MKRSLPVPANAVSDQQRVEERGPGGAIITTSTPGATAAAGEYNNSNGSEQHSGYGYRSRTSSVASYYSTASTATTFGSSMQHRNGESHSSTSLSSLDCFNSIGSSLKRVKISTSPGELRLNKDIEAMAHGRVGPGAGAGGAWAGAGAGVGAQPWISFDEPPNGHGGGGGNISSSSTGGGTSNNNVHYHRNLRSADGTILVRRDIVDPLRLRISVTFRTERPWEMQGWGVMAHNGRPDEMYETWTYLVQIPRMYPHCTPLVHRITREGGTTPTPSNIPELVRQQQRQQQELMRQQQQQQQQQFARQYSSENTSEQAAASASGAALEPPRHGGPNGPPMVERIIISSNPSIHPPSADEGEMTGICIDSDPTAAAASDPLNGTMATFGGWSPISRLSDLVTFLAELPVKRLEAWAARGDEGGGRRPNNGNNSNEHQHRQHQQHLGLPREVRRMGENGSKRGVVRRHISSNHYAYNDYTDAAMEDNGETTNNDRPTHIDRQRRRLSQESEVDVSTIRIGSTHNSEQDMLMEGGQVTSSSVPRLPAKLEEPLPPNRFDQGFDRGSPSLWRSASAPNVVASPSQSSSKLPAGTSTRPTTNEGHWRNPSAPAIQLDGRLPQTAHPPGPSVFMGWGAANTPAAPPPSDRSTFDTTSFRQSNMDTHMMDD